MDRLTVKSADFGEHYALKAMCSFDDKGNIKDEGSCMACCNTASGVCSKCDVQKAFDRLAAYEDTGLDPEEIITMKAENKRLHDLVDIIDGAIKAL